MHLAKIKFQEGIYNSQLNSAQGEWLAGAQRLLKLLFAQCKFSKGRSQATILPRLSINEQSLEKVKIW